MGRLYNRRLSGAERLSDAERDGEIARLEAERERIDEEIERLLSDFARLTRDRTVKKGAMRIGASPKDIGYWNLPDFNGEK